MNSKPIPDIVVGRLPRYLQALEHMHLEGIKTTSSQELGERIGISAAQIRKDLSQFGEFGKQGTGYSIRYLVEQLHDILHITRDWDLTLVGIGDLGNALARYQGFAEHGFHIVLAFDNDPAKVGKSISGIKIQDINGMEDQIRKNQVRIAMLTVPAGSAQAIAEKLVAAGIRAILNYAPISLNLPDGIHVENIDPIVKLQHITYYLD